MLCIGLSFSEIYSACLCALIFAHSLDLALLEAPDEKASVDHSAFCSVEETKQLS